MRISLKTLCNRANSFICKKFWSAVKVFRMYFVAQHILFAVILIGSYTTAYQKVDLNVENDANSPNLIKVSDVIYEHFNETTLLVSANIVIAEKLTYGTKVIKFKDNIQ